MLICPQKHWAYHKSFFKPGVADLYSAMEKGSRCAKLMTSFTEDGAVSSPAPAQEGSRPVDNVLSTAYGYLQSAYLATGIVVTLLPAVFARMLVGVQPTVGSICLTGMLGGSFFLAAAATFCLQVALREHTLSSVLAQRLNAALLAWGTALAAVLLANTAATSAITAWLMAALGGTTAAVAWRSLVLGGAAGATSPSAALSSLGAAALACCRPKGAMPYMYAVGALTCGLAAPLALPSADSSLLAVATAVERVLDKLVVCTAVLAAPVLYALKGCADEGMLHEPASKALNLGAAACCGVLAWWLGQLIKSGTAHPAAALLVLALFATVVVCYASFMFARGRPVTHNAGGAQPTSPPPAQAPLAPQPPPQTAQAL